MGSVKLRMSLFFTLVVFILLAVFATFLYFGLQTLMVRQLERELLAHADAIEDSFDPAADDFKYLQEGTENRAAAQNEYLRIVRADGNLYFVSHRFSGGEPGFPESEARQLEVGGHFMRTVKLPGKADYRAIVLSVPDTGDQRHIAWVELWQSTKPVNASLGFFRKVLLFSLPLALMIVALAAYLMVNRGIRPVALMARMTEEITYDSLDKRLPVLNSDDEFGRLAGRFNELLARLEESSLQQRRLLSNVSHELKTPLAILRSHWESRVTEDSFAEADREQMAADLEEVARLAKMVDDLSLISRSYEDAADLQRESLNISQLIRNLAEDMSVLAGVKNQQIRVESAPEILVSGSPRYLRRLFINILDNAVKYSPENGRIEVNCRAEAGKVIITIHDDGPGIPAADLPKVFDRFYRSPNVRDSQIRGSGLGLTLARWIAELHDGSLTISAPEGDGTSVCFIMPELNKPISNSV